MPSDLIQVVGMGDIYWFNGYQYPDQVWWDACTGSVPGGSGPYHLVHLVQGRYHSHRISCIWYTRLYGTYSLVFFFKPLLDFFEQALCHTVSFFEFFCNFFRFFLKLDMYWHAECGCTRIMQYWSESWPRQCWYMKLQTLIWRPLPRNGWIREKWAFHPFESILFFLVYSPFLNHTFVLSPVCIDDLASCWIPLSTYININLSKDFNSVMGLMQVTI